MTLEDLDFHKLKKLNKSLSISLNKVNIKKIPSLSSSNIIK